MNTRCFAAVLLTVSLFTFSCQRPLILDDDAPPVIQAKWELLDNQQESPIQGLHVTPAELFVISNNQFSRYGKDHKPVEQRMLDVGAGVNGTPAISDHTFVRLTTNEQFRQMIEFHLTRNAAQVFKIQADSLLHSGNEFLEIEFLARKLGAFNTDGTLFMLPARIFPDRYYAFFIFEIIQNPAHTAFTSVKIVKRVDIQDFGADFANLINLRFLGGNFYATSRSGAWRITPAGAIKKISTEWTRDVFSWKGKLYSTRFNNFELHESIDNGQNWTRLNQSSDLKMVEIAGDRIFTQEVLGNPYQLVPEDFIKASTIVYPPGVTTNPTAYFAVAFFENEYYFSIDREIYFTKEVITE